MILLWRQGRHHVPRHARDNKSCAARCDDVLELFKNYRRAIQIDGQNPLWRGHVRRHTSSIDDLDNATKCSGCLNQRLDRSARRYIDNSRLDGIAGISQILRRSLQCLLVEIGEQKSLAKTLQTSNGETDTASTDYYNYFIFHTGSPWAIQAAMLN
ncbi:hypothetical protein D3C73_1123370 [compost metagenome]